MEVVGEVRVGVAEDIEEGAVGEVALCGAEGGGNAGTQANH